jgi:hypothetical protein
MDEVTFELSKKLGDNLMIDESGKDVDVHELLENVADLIFNDKKQVAAIFMQALTRTAENAQFREKVAVEYDENLVKFHNIFSGIQKSGQIPADVDITEAFKAIYGLTMGLAFIYHMLEKDHREAKKIWIESVERILMLRPGAAR